MMEVNITYSGRQIDTNDVIFIKNLINNNPGKSRCFISKELCRLWDWKQRNGYLIENNFWWLDLRQRIGYEFISIDEWSEKGIFLSTGLLVGYHNYFAELAMPLFFSNEGTAIGVQMGVGVRFEF